MMFRCFRFFLILMSLIVIVLEGLAFTSAYKNEDFLTSAYLVNFHLNKLDLNQLFLSNKFTKRDDGLYRGNCAYGNSGSFGYDPCTSLTNSITTTTTNPNTVAYATGSPDNTIQNPESPTRTYEGSQPGSVYSSGGSYYTDVYASYLIASAIAAGSAAGSAAASAEATAATTGGFNSAGLYTQSTLATESQSSIASQSSKTSVPSSTAGLSPVGQVIYQLSNSNTYAELGLADVYAVNMWGYCKGTYANKENMSTTFDNNNITYYWCSKPKAAYFFDPLTVLKQEFNNTIANTTYEATTRAELQILVDHISYDNLNLPGNLGSKLKSMRSLQQAVFGILLTVIITSFISIIIQLLGCILSPDHCLLSFLNYLFQCAIVVLSLIAAAIATGQNVYVRNQVNNVTYEFGVKSYISVPFYAYVWSAVAAGWVLCCIALLGHCCGLFATSRRKFRKVAQHDDHEAHHEEHHQEHHQEHHSEKGESSSDSE